MFLHVSVCPQGVVSRPIPRGGRLGGLAGGSPGPYPGGGWGVWPGRSPGPYPGGGWGVWPGRGVSRPRPGGSRLRPRGLSRPRIRGGSRPRCVCVCIYPSMHMETPPSRWLLLWTVRILLECILVLDVI